MILKPPGLIFEDLGLNFFEIFACFWLCLLRTCRHLAENLPRSCTACGRLLSIAKLLVPRSVGPRSSEGGWGGGGPPPGGLQLNPPSSRLRDVQAYGTTGAKLQAKSRLSFAYEWVRIPPCWLKN